VKTYKEGRAFPHAAARACIFSPKCFSYAMRENVHERAVWLSRNVLPFESLIRSRLRRKFIYGLEIDDVIQEMYERIASLPSLDAIKHPLRYASQTATAIVIDHMRRSRVISINAAGTLDQLDICAPEPSPEQQMEFREEIAAVAQFLAQLPERTREVLILRRVEGLSQQETADRLHISIKTVEKHMALGVAALMTWFGRGGKTVRQPSMDLRIENYVCKTNPSRD
jgi:RNA polymerase sigma factor (sigma-70 family)